MRFFVTGNDSVKLGLDLKQLTPIGSYASNFASKGQTLQQSYSIAEDVFKLFEHGQINFVLIGLAPDILFLDENGNLTADSFDKNLQALEDYIKLCHDNGAKSVVLLMPFAQIARKRYEDVFLKPLLNILAELEKIHDFKTVNFFDLNLTKSDFADETHLNENGRLKMSNLLTLNLYLQKVLTEENLCHMSYDYFYLLSYLEDKKFFHAIMDKVFSCTLNKLRHKKKIRIAFVTDHAAMWCGDKLYNLFAQNPRFDTTVFVCHGNESTLQDSQHDLEQFKMAGINAVGIFDLDKETPPQDIVFFLRPYIEQFSKSFQLSVMTPQTLTTYIPYILEIAPSFLNDFYNRPIFRLAWKIFFDAEEIYKFNDSQCSIGIPRGVISGAPKMDFFFSDMSKLHFSWKMARPDAKKIIWAPHHSFTKNNIAGIKGTFPYNFQFMYEFAKAHPEISWVVKPHPKLLLAAVSWGLFSSVNAYERYLQKWNDLPNAQVYTGAYYQVIFATSDGMIQDSGSFIAEYQYTHKPMIYLLNDEREEFNERARKILSVSYVVDGKDTKLIADTIQKVFIEGNDSMFDERLKVFDTLLNYQHLNGMSASEFIFKTVVDELESVS